MVAKCDPAPPYLIGVMKDQCTSQDKEWFTGVCGYHKKHLSRTAYCNCFWAEGCCCNPLTHKEYQSTNEEETVVIDDIVEDEQDKDQDVLADQGIIVTEVVNPGEVWDQM